MPLPKQIRRMFDWLFPTWSNPALLAAVVAARGLLDASLTAIVGDALGYRSPLTLAAAAVTLLSVVVMVLVLRPGTLGHRASLVEIAGQLGLVAVGAYAVYANPSTGRIVGVALVSVGILALAGLTIPLYGEATVAP